MVTNLSPNSSQHCQSHPQLMDFISPHKFNLCNPCSSCCEPMEILASGNGLLSLSWLPIWFSLSLRKRQRYWGWCLPSDIVLAFSKIDQCLSALPLLFSSSLVFMFLLHRPRCHFITAGIVLLNRCLEPVWHHNKSSSLQSASAWNQSPLSLWCDLKLETLQRFEKV